MLAIYLTWTLGDISEVALTMVAGVPLNRTSRFDSLELNSMPSIVTTVAGGPVNGAALVICGGSAL